MKKFLLSFLSMILCLFVVTACGNSEVGASSTKSSTEKSRVYSFDSESSNEKSTQNSPIQNSKNSNTASENSSNKNSEASSESSKTESKKSNSENENLIPLTPQAESVLNASISSTTLITDNKVENDLIILPRVSGDGLSYISWQSQNENIIDNDGVVYQTNSNQTVDLVAYFSYGEYIKKQTYSVTVLPKKQDSANITENDSRILKKITVSSVNELKSAFSSAKAGDAIILNDGNYSGFSATLSSSGTKNNPIFIIAKNPQKAIFTGSTSLKLSGDHIIVCGLSFSNGAPKEDKGCLIFSGDYSRVTNCKIYNYCDGNAYKWLSLSGKYNEVDHNVFDGKSTEGALLTVWRDDSSAQHHHIHHNVFKNYASGGGDNGFETIRIGDSKMSQSDAYCLVENNYFEACNGEVEMVSVKSGRNILRNNTFVSCEGHITFRHGKNNLAKNNVFLCNTTANSGGIRMYDGGHIVVDNYVEGQRSSSNTRGGIVVHSGVNKVTETPTINTQWTAYNCLVKNNTLVDCQQSIMFCGKYEYASKDITVINNLIYNSNIAGLRINKAFDNLLSSGNIAFAKSLYTSNSTENNMTGITLNAYSEPSRNSNNLVEKSGVGASGLVVIKENQVGNY